MTTLSQHERFVQDTIACQPSLFAYILSLTADPDWADDILQETNLALLRQEQDYTPGTNFLAWATTVAYYEVLSSRKRRQRNKLVFDDALLETFASEAPAVISQQDVRRTALRRCLAELPEHQRHLLKRRFARETVTQIAADMRRTVASISQTLYRIRSTLKACVRKKLPEGTP